VMGGIMAENGLSEEVRQGCWASTFAYKIRN
jgi:hypothetical protein